MCPQRNEVRRFTSVSEKGQPFGLNLFPNTEIAEHHVEEILDIYMAGDTSEGTGGEAQVLGGEFWQISLAGAGERSGTVFQRAAVARAGERRRGASHITLRPSASAWSATVQCRSRLARK